jgi:hypothetical protein
MKEPEKCAKVIYKEERVGKKRRCRPLIGWMEGIENILKVGVRSTRCRRACIKVEKVKDICFEFSLLTC